MVCLPARSRLRKLRRCQVGEALLERPQSEPQSPLRRPQRHVLPGRDLRRPVAADSRASAPRRCSRRMRRSTASQGSAPEHTGDGMLSKGMASRGRPAFRRTRSIARWCASARSQVRALPRSRRNVGAARLSWLEMHPSALRGRLIRVVQAAQDGHRAYRPLAAPGPRR